MNRSLGPVFNFGENALILEALAAVIVAQPVEMRMMRNPDVHGNTLAFTYAGDLWTMDRTSGIASRITSAPGGETNPRFSPDGKWIAFTGAYDGALDVFVVPVEGGVPKRLTHGAGASFVSDWTPDGKIAYSSPMGSISSRIDTLWTVDPKGGMPQPTVIDEFDNGSYSPDGTMVAYNKGNSYAFNWRRYRGGTQGVIDIYNFKNNTSTQVKQGKENNWQPMWIGGEIYYISDKVAGTRNLYKYNTNSKAVTQLTKFADSDIRNPRNDEKTIVWERNGFLESYDIATGATSRVKAQVKSDFLTARPRWANVASTITGMALSPSGVRLAVDGRGDIFSVPAKNGDTRNMTDSQGVREQNPRWSPDGQTISYLSDKSGEVQLYTRPQMGGAEKMHKVSTLIISHDWAPNSKTISYNTRDGELRLLDVATGADTLVAKNAWQANIGYDWAPDSSWIAYITAGDNLQGLLNLYNVESKKSTKVSEGYFGDEQVTFDQDGKYLYIMSGRTFYPAPGAFEFILNMGNPYRAYMLALQKDTKDPFMRAGDEEPVKAPEGQEKTTPSTEAKTPETKGLRIDLEGLADRILPLPWGPGEINGIVGVKNGVLGFGPAGIQLFSVTARATLPIYQGPLTNVDINAARTKLAINTGAGITIMSVAPGQDPNAGRVNTSGVAMMWDPKAEWKQIFWESWRFQRDVFYDKNMLGLDWKAIGEQYAAYLPYVQHRNDLNSLLGQMIGELGTGHAYVGGGDLGETVRPVPTGLLGADLAPSGKYVQFKKVLQGAPYDEARRSPLNTVGAQVEDGEYLLAIDGDPVTSDKDPYAHLVGKAGRIVTLKVNKTPTMAGARDIQVRTVADETEIRYISWVEENRAKVAAKSNGRIGYIHVPDTSIPGVIEFMRGFYSQTDKDGWIIDERYNGGGMIPTFFVEFLTRTYTSRMKARDWKDIGFPTGTLEGPKVMLVNEYAGSGGDMLPWLFREAKAGQLIGKRTWGGLVGIQGSAPLIDGGFLSSPGFGIYDHKKGQWIAENIGVEPDIEVERRPERVAMGYDDQLDRAIAVVQAEIRKRGPRGGKTPDFIRPKN